MLIGRAGNQATLRFLEFFTVNIRNPNTRAAYGRAAGMFLGWCEEHGIAELGQVRRVHVAACIEQLQATRSPPTVKQHLASLRMLFDWLVTGQVIPSNPAHAVRGPRHSVSKGATAVISSAEARELLDSMDSSTVVGLRDRAIIAVMAFTFARVSAVVGLKVEVTIRRRNASGSACVRRTGKSMTCLAITSSRPIWTPTSQPPESKMMQGTAFSNGDPAHRCPVIPIFIPH